jgi:hypothetical protein
MKRHDQPTTPHSAEDGGKGEPPVQEARSLHPAVAATLREQQALQEGTARLEALFRDPQALTNTLQHAIASAISEHHAAGRSVYFTKGGIIYEEDASGQQRPYQVQQQLTQESSVVRLHG